MVETMLGGEKVIRTTVVFVQYTDPARYPPLQHAAELLLREGITPEFLAVEMGGIRFPEHLATSVRYLMPVRQGWRNLLSFAWFHLCVLWRLLVLRRRGPIIVYGSDLLSTPTLVVADLLGFPCIFHEHDAPACLNQPGRWERVLLGLRRRAFARMLTVVPSRERLAATGGPKPGVGQVIEVWNCPRLEEVAESKPMREPSRSLLLYFHGSINDVLLPLSLLDVLSQAPESVSLEFAGYETIGSQGYVSMFTKRADALGLARRVRHLGVLGRRELLAACRRADIGICLYGGADIVDPNLRHIAKASNKPFDYLSQGLALCYDDTPQWRKLFDPHQLGWPIDVKQPQTVARLLSELIAKPELVQARGEHGRQMLLLAWNYEQQFAPVLAWIKARGESA